MKKGTAESDKELEDMMYLANLRRRARIAVFLENDTLAAYLQSRIDIFTQNAG